MIEKVNGQGYVEYDFAVVREKTKTCRNINEANFKELVELIFSMWKKRIFFPGKIFIQNFGINKEGSIVLKDLGVVKPDSIYKDNFILYLRGLDVINNFNPLNAFSRDKKLVKENILSWIKCYLRLFIYNSFFVKIWVKIEIENVKEYLDDFLKKHSIKKDEKGRLGNLLFIPASLAFLISIAAFVMGFSTPTAVTGLLFGEVFEIFGLLTMITLFAGKVEFIPGDLTKTNLSDDKVTVLLENKYNLDKNQKLILKAVISNGFVRFNSDILRLNQRISSMPDSTMNMKIRQLKEIGLIVVPTKDRYILSRSLIDDLIEFRLISDELYKEWIDVVNIEEVFNKFVYPEGIRDKSNRIEGDPLTGQDRDLMLLILEPVKKNGVFGPEELRNKYSFLKKKYDIYQFQHIISLLTESNVLYSSVRARYLLSSDFVEALNEKGLIDKEIYDKHIIILKQEKLFNQFSYENDLGQKTKGNRLADEDRKFTISLMEVISEIEGPFDSEKLVALFIKKGSKYADKKPLNILLSNLVNAGILDRPVSNRYLFSRKFINSLFEANFIDEFIKDKWDNLLVRENEYKRLGKNREEGWTSSVLKVLDVIVNKNLEQFKLSDISKELPDMPMRTLRKSLGVLGGMKIIKYELNVGYSVNEIIENIQNRVIVVEMENKADLEQDFREGVEKNEKKGIELVRKKVPGYDESKVLFYLLEGLTQEEIKLKGFSSAGLIRINKVLTEAGWLRRGEKRMLKPTDAAKELVGQSSEDIIVGSEIEQILINIGLVTTNEDNIKKVEILLENNLPVRAAIIENKSLKTLQERIEVIKRIRLKNGKTANYQTLIYYPAKKIELIEEIIRRADKKKIDVSFKEIKDLILVRGEKGFLEDLNKFVNSTAINGKKKPVDSEIKAERERIGNELLKAALIWPKKFCELFEEIEKKKLVEEKTEEFVKILYKSPKCFEILLILEKVMPVSKEEAIIKLKEKGEAIKEVFLVNSGKGISFEDALPGIENDLFDAFIRNDNGEIVLLGKVGNKRKKDDKRFISALGYNLKSLMEATLEITDAVLNPQNMMNMFLGEKKEGEGKREYEFDVSDISKDRSDKIIAKIPKEFLAQTGTKEVQVKGTTREDLVSTEKMWA
ncbi:hypothetical protein KAI68_06235, partial [bacterium]|nr:hypothetical protein [bacterium]